MDPKQFSELSRKIDILIKLTALNSIQGKNLQEQILLLFPINLKPIEIATLLHKPKNIITATMSNLRKDKLLPPLKESSNKTNKRKSNKTDSKKKHTGE